MNFYHTHFLGHYQPATGMLINQPHFLYRRMTGWSEIRWTQI